MNIAAAKIHFSQEDRASILTLVDEALMTGQLTLGKNTRQFEEEFIRTAGTRFACAVNSGTSALEIALRAFGVAGREVLVPTNTFFATAAAVVHAGGNPRFVDCDPSTLSIDMDSLERRWRPECAAVMVVHIGGAVAPVIREVQRFCRSRGMSLIEDAAHAHGSTLDRVPAGSFGDAAAFSFYPTKVMTSAEGGMVVTNLEHVHSEALILRDQGKASFGTNLHTRMGYNWRMSEVHAAIGLVHHRRLPEMLHARRQIAAWYDDALQKYGELQGLRMPTGSVSNYYKFPVFLPSGVNRAEVKGVMRERYRIALSGEVYELPCHKQPVFAPWADSPLPGAEEACARHVCLPLYPSLTQDDVRYVVLSLAQTLESLKAEVHH